MPSAVIVAPAFRPATGTQEVGILAGATPLDVEVALGPDNLGALAAAAAAVSTPTNPQYRHYLSPSSVYALLGASPAAISAAEQYFQGFGLRASASPDGFLLQVTGPAASVASAFHTEFRRYAEGGRVFFSHPSPASLPSGLPWYGVVGLGNATPIQPSAGAPFAARATHPLATCAVSGLLPPCAIWTAYDESALFAAGTNGSGATVGVVDVYDSAEPASRLASDFSQFTTDYALPAQNFSFAYPLAAGNSLNTSSSTGWGNEEALDLEWARASAPGAKIVMALTANTNAAIYGAVDWFVSERRADALSLSWGEPDVGIYNAALAPCPNQCNASSDGSYGLLHPVLLAAAAEGMTVFAASGDCGAADGTSGVSTNYPSSDPWVSGVGGTSLSVSSSGVYASEVGWSGNASGASSPGCQNQGGSGGGYAPFPRPAWQSGTGLAANGLRGVPDVSLNAASAVPIIYQGNLEGVVGTSISTPVWAGIAAIADQAGGAPVGFLNPALYSLLRSGRYGSDFHDILSGSNGYSAHAGWDPVTGVGSPIVSALLPDLLRGAPSVPSLFVTVGVDVRSGTAPLMATFTAHARGGSAPYPQYDFVFGDGNATLTGTNVTLHDYQNIGVFEATVTVFDSQGNSSSSYPIAVVVGGGALLTVGLAANLTTAAVGARIGFAGSVSGASGAITYTVWFGDGTYSLPGPSASASHRYASAGGYCAALVAQDSATPPDGGASLPIALSIGGAPRPLCAAGPPLFGNLTSARLAADLPGDLPLRWNDSGGSGPLTTWLDAGDRYATSCQCGIFRTAGNFTLRLYVNDSTGDQIVRSLNVTIYPALGGSFTASVQSGNAPLLVNFTALLSGGFGPNSSRTHWSFGDGGSGNGSSLSHLYLLTGEFLAVASAGDLGGGNASEAFLIDVHAPTAPAGLTATVGPARFTDAGTPSELRASAPGLSGSPLFLWNFSDGSSAFGASVSDSPNPATCPVFASCTLGVRLTAIGAGGTRLSVEFNLTSFFAGRASALNLTEQAGARSGTTPFRWNSSLLPTGMPGSSVSWRFGDGGVGAGPRAQHAYLTPGNYTVTAMPSDPAGESWVRPQAVAVNGSAIAPLAVGISPVLSECVGVCVVAFSANLSGGVGPPLNYSWNFGDGGTAFTGSASHTYTVPGAYNATLRVTDAWGDLANASASVTFYPATAVRLILSVAAGTVAAGATLRGTLLAYPFCGARSVPGCLVAPIPVTLVLHEGNLSSPALSRYDQGVLFANATDSFALAAPSSTGEVWLEAVAAGPNFTGSSAVRVTVVPAPSSADLRAGEILLAAGVGAGLAVALVAVLLYRARERDRPRAPPPGATIEPPPPG